MTSVITTNIVLHKNTQLPCYSLRVFVMSCLDSNGGINYWLVATFSSPGLVSPDYSVFVKNVHIFVGLRVELSFNFFLQK